MVKAGRATASELPGYEELKAYHFTLGACQPTERNGKSRADSDHSLLLRAVEGLLRPDRAVRRIRDIRPGAVCKTSLAQPQPHQDRSGPRVAHHPRSQQGPLRAADRRSGDRETLDREALARARARLSP